jgi:hypothetical protein
MPKDAKPCLPIFPNVGLSSISLGKYPSCRSVIPSCTVTHPIVVAWTNE